MSNEWLKDRALQRSRCSLSEAWLERLWPTFPREFISIYERRDNGIKVPVRRKQEDGKEESTIASEKNTQVTVTESNAPSTSGNSTAKSLSYAVPMLKGEAEAILPYIQSGARIPRRGEIGLSATEIASYERAGYVMSGSRNAYMTAMRMKKENAVMSVEEEKRLRMLSVEATKKRERELLDSFKSMIKKPPNP